MKTKAIIVQQYGDVSILQWQDTTLPELGGHDVLVQNHAVGFNMIDTYFRKGLYPAELPFVLGAESAGVVMEVGQSVKHYKPGDRVACVQPKSGAYARHRIVPESDLIHIPEEIDFETAAACLLKGMTAQFLLKQSYKVQAGDTIVIYAAAGGVGSILTQWAKYLGATVIAISGSAEKCQIAKSHGADFTIDMSSVAVADIPLKISELTSGKGVPVVYDSLGQQTFIASLDCLQPRGLLVSYGNATGAVENVNLLDLAKRGSLYVTRPVLFSYVDTPEKLAASATDLFNVVKKDIVSIKIGQRFPLENATQAHLAAESRQTQGSTILIP